MADRFALPSCRLLALLASLASATLDASAAALPADAVEADEYALLFHPFPVASLPLTPNEGIGLADDSSCVQPSRTRILLLLLTLRWLEERLRLGTIRRPEAVSAGVFWYMGYNSLLLG